MNTSRLLLLILAALPVFSQNELKRDPAAVALAERSIGIMGGAQLQHYQDVLVTGNLILTSPTPKIVPIIIKAKDADKVRSELQTENGTTIQIVNHGRAVILQGNKTHWLIAENSVRRRVDFIPVLSLLGASQDSTVAVESAGSLKVNGSPADGVVLSVSPTAKLPRHLRDATRKTFAIDQASGLVTMMKFSQFAENNASRKRDIQILFSDYRNFNGIVIPFHQSRYADGQLESELQFDSVTFNSGLSDSEFALPR